MYHTREKRKPPGHSNKVTKVEHPPRQCRHEVVAMVMLARKAARVKPWNNTTANAYDWQSLEHRVQYREASNQTVLQLP